MREPSRIYLAFALMICTAGAATAQSANGAMPASEAKTSDRAAAVDGILVRWAGQMSDGGAELREALANASATTIAAASQAESRAALNQALFGHVGGPNILGENNSDLVLFPLTPCRLVDTRLGGGILSANTSRDFETQGNLAAQGGSATGCGVPGTDPAALVLTITAVNPQGAGNLRAYPTGAVAPNASVVNYALPGQGLNLANTTVVPLLQDAGTTAEFTIRADVSDVHVVIDVVGYFWRPEPVCSTGRTLFHGKCFENAPRAAATVFVASDTCHAAGGRLPDGLELRSLRAEGGVNLVAEWTDSVFSADGTTFFAMVVSDDGGYDRSSTLTPHVYRCVFNRFLP